MIKFFRKIRYNLMETGKTGKYFKYAIGEIFLVVIGILIALQINNWNETHKENTKEASYLENLRRDLTNQIQSIEEQIVRESDYIDSATFLTDSFVDGQFILVDSTFFINLTQLQSRKTFVITDPTYTDLLSSGNIDIIKSKKLKDEVIQYYQELERIEKVIQNNNSLLVDQQYANTFFDLGYYFRDEETLISLFNAKDNLDFNTSYQRELERTSQKLLEIPENSLKLMNVISLRKVLSLGSLHLMQSTKERTQVLLTKVFRAIDD